MKKYSIVRVGDEYVVQAGQTSILKVSSPEEAAKLVTDAAELLQPRPDSSADEDPSTARDQQDRPDSPGDHIPVGIPDATELP